TYVTPKYDILISATYQNYPGPQLSATFSAPNSVVAPLLPGGRNLSSCPAPTGACNQNASLNLATPGTLYGTRLNVLDLRVGKVLRSGRTRTNLTVDLYNALNIDTTQTYSQTYTSPAANYLTPTL